MSDPTLIVKPAYTPLEWAALAQFAATPFPDGWPDSEWVFFSPRDPGVHKAILAVISSCSHSLYGNHFGFTDAEVAEAAASKLHDPFISCVLNLDDRQEAGPTEKALVEKVFAADIGTSVAIGHSIHAAISHLKVWVVDGLYTISGSTNLSLGGEQKQDNELRITRNPYIAMRYTNVIQLNHIAMLGQMAAKAQKAVVTPPGEGGGE